MKDGLIAVLKPLGTDSIVMLLFKARGKKGKKSRRCLSQQSHQQLMDALTDIRGKRKIGRT